MMGGYKQDHYKFKQKCETNPNYRIYNWGMIDIFIYFSHYRITIPPSSYINICHQNGVKCLGTFITEWEEGQKENITLLNGIEDNIYYYADKLIEICKFYKFDGFLLNFESKIEDTQKLIKWVDYLTTNIKKSINNDCIIVWYDSIVVPSGQVKWQSMLNSLNQEFFQITDYFFTDYHWDLEKLNLSIQNSQKNQDKIYTGVDIWGRGQYEGGQYNTFKSLKAIQQVGGNVALFAPAYTFENNCNNQNEFINNDQQLWFGIEQQELFNNQTQNQQWKNIINGSQGWKNEKTADGTIISTTSFQPCIRYFEIKLDQLNLEDKIDYQLEFQFEVKGSPPNCKDQYNAGIHLYDNQGKIITEINLIQDQFQKSCLIATENWQHHVIKINIQKNQYPSLSKIQFIQMGKDVEFWAGHYGTCFKNDKIILKSYQKEKDFSSYLNQKSIQNQNLPYSTFFNEGQGNYYYINGKQYQKYTNNLNDFDLPQFYITKQYNTNTQISDIFNTKLSNLNAWNGQFTELNEIEPININIEPFNLF